MSNSAAPWTAACQSPLSFTISWSLLKMKYIQSVMPSSHLILCHPLFLLLSVFPKELAVCISWSKYWSFSTSLSNEYSGLTSWIDWFYLLAIQGTCKSLLQHHSLKVSTLLCSAFFMVQLSRPYMTTGKTIDFTIWAFVGKVMSLLFTMLSRFVIAFLPSNKCLLNS